MKRNIYQPTDKLLYVKISILIDGHFCSHIWGITTDHSSKLLEEGFIISKIPCIAGNVKE